MSQSNTTENTHAAADTADVQAHAPANGRTETIDGERFEFRPLRVKQFFPFLALARPLFAALAKASSPPAPGLPPATAEGQGGESTQGEPDTPAPIPAAQLQALVGNTDAILTLLETEGPTAIRALAVALERNQSDEAQAAMVDKLEDLTLVGLVVAFKHFVVVNADFFAAQGLRLPPGGLLGAVPAPVVTDGGRAPAASRQRPRKR